MENNREYHKKFSERPKLDKLQIRISSPTKESIVAMAALIEPVIKKTLLQVDPIKQNRFEDGHRLYLWCSLSGVENEHGEKTETSN